MKKLPILLLLIIIKLSAFAQPGKSIKKMDLPTVTIDNNISIHFVSPEPIQYVDISSKSIVGDLPVGNVLRIKHVKQKPLMTDTSKFTSPAKKKEYDLSRIVQDLQEIADVEDEISPAVITIVGEKFYAQYRIIYNPNAAEADLRTSIEILPSETSALDVSGAGLTKNELRKFSQSVYNNRPRIFGVKSTNYKLQANLNNIYTLDNYIFLDITWKNSTNLRYDIDQIRFKIEDKKQVKSTNVQSLEIKPEFVLNEEKLFKRSYRNIYVFKKFTFPGDKVFNVEITEKQISGRNLSLLMDYSDLLQADTIIK